MTCLGRADLRNPFPSQIIRQIGALPSPRPLHKISTFEAFEVKDRVRTLLDWVEAGDEVVITRLGRVVARLVPANAGHDRAEARRVADALLAVTRGWRLNGVTVNELRADGRR